MYTMSIGMNYKIWTKSIETFKKTHRKNIFKPAIEYFNGAKSYVYYGSYYSIMTTYDYIEIVKCFSSRLSLGENGHRLSLGKNPAVFYKNGTKEWYDLFGLLHRDKDLPAIEYSNGDIEHWVHGKRHGVTSCRGKQYYFENGEFVKCIV